MSVHQKVLAKLVHVVTHPGEEAMAARPSFCKHHMGLCVITGLCCFIC